MHRLTDRELAALLGITAQTVSLWRHGKRAPGSSTLIKAAELFGLPANLLYADPTELLPLAAEPDRFIETERKISQERRGLKAVQ